MEVAVQLLLEELVDLEDLLVGDGRGAFLLQDLVNRLEDGFEFAGYKI